MSEKQQLIGSDGLAEFCDYLQRLEDSGYIFEMEDASGRLVTCSRDDALRSLQGFHDSNASRFRVV